MSVATGSTVGFTANPDIYHPGPLQFYLAKVPASQICVFVHPPTKKRTNYHFSHPPGLSSLCISQFLGWSRSKLNINTLPPV